MHACVKPLAETLKFAKNTKHFDNIIHIDTDQVVKPCGTNNEPEPKHGMWQCIGNFKRRTKAHGNRSRGVGLLHASGFYLLKDGAALAIKPYRKSA